MKKKINFFTATRSMALIAFVALAGFVISGCDMGDGGGGGKGSLSTKNLTIAGKFHNGTKDVSFIAEAGSGARSIAGVRAIGASDFALAGYLEDGDIRFNLKGSYNTDTKTYSLSAASSIIIYSISGEFNNDGKAETGKSKAVVQVNNGSTWTTHEVSSITVVTNAAEIDDIEAAVQDDDLTPAADAPGSIPLNMRGIWRDPYESSFYALVNEYSVIVYEKVGSTWIETDTMYFTGITNQGSYVDGETSFYDWDWDAISTARPNWWQDMLIAYATLEGISYKDQRLLQAEFSLTPQALTIANKYNRLTTSYGWSFPWGSPPSQTFFDNFNNWFYTTKGYTGVPGLAQLQEYASDTVNGGKAACTAAGAVVERSLSFKSNDVFPGNMIITQIPDGGGGYFEMHEPSPAAQTQFNNCMNELGNAINAWAKNQGYVTEDSVREKMYNDRYEDVWLTANLTPKSTYYKQWYTKMALKMSGGMLIYGQYVKDGTVGHWEGLDWISEGPGDWPVFAVTNYSQLGTLNELKWMQYGLSR